MTSCHPLAFMSLPAARKSRASVRRGCRAYQRRTTDVVGRSVASWQAISGLSAPPFLWEGGSCQELARTVKKYLSLEASSDASLQMGFQSIKKLLPDSCRCMESGLLDDLVLRLGRAPRSLPPGYLSFVKRETRRLFPKGWDSSYERHCLSTSPSLSSCCESGRRTGGALSVVSDQSAYLDRVLHGRDEKLCPYYAGQLLVVQSAGKPRPLSKFPAASLYLKPLHKTIYGSLSSRKWLLRGPPSKEALRRAGFSDGGGVLVSGDYRSATDNLPIEVMEVALAEMLGNSTFIPESVKELALRACRPILFSEKESFEVSVGQMMGSLLSFPFLCYQNFLAFRWACRSGCPGRYPPVLINGDDILFQTDVPSFPEHWFKVVGEVGLEVEETKTSVEDSWGTLNSTLLRFVSGTLCPVWSPRFGMLRPAEFPNSLGRSFLDFLSGCPSELRYRAGRVWFDWHIGELRSAALSLDSLGFRGLLALRLAKKYSLLHFPSSELVAPYHRHGVFFSGDFVTRLPRSAVDSELSFSSSVEVAAAKWNEGYSPVSIDREAIRYCIARSASKGARFDYPSIGRWFYADSAEFAFLLAGCVPGVGVSRRMRTKAYLSPIPVDDTVLIATAIVDSLVFDFGRGPLPPYSEVPLPGELFECRPGVFVVG